MNNINNFIFEKIGPHLSQRQPKDTVIHFKGIVPMFLYKAEFEGQISDGKYEGARPYNHWEWIPTTKCIADGNEYYTSSFPHSKNNYSFNDFIKYVKSAIDGDDEYSWALRILYYGRFAKALESSRITKYNDNDNFSYIAEIFGTTLYNNPDAEFEDTESYIKDYMKRYTNSKLYSKKYFDLYKNTEYDIKELKEDIKSMCTSINTFNSEE